MQFVPRALKVNPVSAALGKAVLSAKTARHNIQQYANDFLKSRRQPPTSIDPAGPDQGRLATSSVCGSEKA